MKTKHKVSYASIVRHYRNWMAKATPNVIAEASHWYDDARLIAEGLTESLGFSDVLIGACILSAFSPRERWSINVSRAWAFVENRPLRGLGQNKRRAEHVLALVKQKQCPLQAMTGLKIRNFALAISGDENAVTIDSWMMRAARITKDSPTAKQYGLLVKAIETVAREYNLTPRTTQACIWLMVRGS